MPLKFIRRVSGGFSGGLLPVACCLLPVSRQKRPESLSEGAAKRCYCNVYGVMMFLFFMQGLILFFAC